jgi:hypothetical protein
VSRCFNILYCMRRFACLLGWFACLQQSQKCTYKSSPDSWSDKVWKLILFICHITQNFFRYNLYLTLVFWVAVLTRKKFKQKYTDLRTIYISNVKSISMMPHSCKAKHLNKVSWKILQRWSRPMTSYFILSKKCFKILQTFC